MPSPNSIHAVLFDLDGTLRHNRPGGFETFVEYLEELGHIPAPAQIYAGERWNHYYWAASPELVADIAEAGGEDRALWKRHAERQLCALGVSGDVTALAAEMNRMFTERYEFSHHVPEDVVPTLTRLRELGYVVGLVSNRSDPLDAIAAELGLTDQFHFTLSAGQAQSWKPSPEIFLRAVLLAGCAPEAAVYVGDNYYADVEGARGAGLQPVLIDPKGIFPEPGCPVIHALSDLEDMLERLGTKPEARASVL
jgi:HAD superfamily hydrolase (TIGR01549 family)